MKKKICLFSLNYLSFGGGAEKYFSEVGRILAQKGHHVFFLGDCKGILSTFPLLGLLLGLVPLRKILPAVGEIRGAKPLDEDLPIGFIRLSLASFVPFSRRRREVSKFLVGCDYLLVRNEFIDMLCLCLLSPQYLKKSLAIMFASLYYPDPRTFRARAHNLIYLSRLYGFLLKKFAAVVVSNKFDQSFVAKQYNVPKTSIFLVPYGLVDSNFSFDRKNTAHVAKLTISFVGRLEEQKGVDYLSPLLSQLSRKKFFNNLEFCIAGSGPQETLAKDLASRYSNVKHLGFLEFDKLCELYDRSDAVVVPSRWETFSYVTLEAQSRGTLVIAFDVSGPNEIVLDGKTGFIVPPGNIEGMVRSIEEVYDLKVSTPQHFIEMQKRAYREAREGFSLSKTAHRLEEIMQRR